MVDQDETLSELREMADSNEEDEKTMDSKVLKVSGLLIMHSDYLCATEVSIGTLLRSVRLRCKYEEMERAEHIHSDPGGSTVLYAGIDVEICISV